jgi:hypothetical protein
MMANQRMIAFPATLRTPELSDGMNCQQIIGVQKLGVEILDGSGNGSRSRLRFHGKIKRQ